MLKQKRTSRKKMIGIVALPVLMAILPVFFPGNASAALEPVMNGSFNQQASTLIGDFGKELEAEIKARTQSADMIEAAAQEMADCDSLLGRNDLDEARYAECVTISAQKAQAAYKKSNQEMAKIDQQLTRYRKQMQNGIKENKDALQAEISNLNEDKKVIAHANKQATELITKISSLEPETKLSWEEMDLVEKLVDKLESSLNMKGLHQQACDKIEVVVAMQENIGGAIDGLRHDVQRNIRQTKYRISETTEAIRIMRNYGIGRARLIEGRAVVEGLQSLKDVLKTANSLQGYEKMLAQLGSGVSQNHVVLPEAPTAGDALSILKSLINQQEPKTDA